MERQQRIELGENPDDDGGSVISKSGRRRGKLNKKALHKLDKASISRTSRSARPGSGSISGQSSKAGSDVSGQSSASRSKSRPRAKSAAV